jgi:TRAP-type C4-dicarboxylate transport system permease small subunit
MDKLLKWIELPIHALVWVGVAAGVLMMVHVTADVGARAINQPFSGTTEIASAYYMILITYLPWAWIARNDEHITVELFTRFLPGRVLEWIDLVVKVVTAVYVSVFAWMTLTRAIEQMKAGEAIRAAAGYVYTWPGRYVLPLAGALMVVYLVLRVARDLSRHFRT